MTTDLLHLEVRLMLLRHGRRKLVEALAQAGEQTVEQLEQDIVTATAQVPNKARRSKAAAPSVVETVFAHRGDVLPVVHAILMRYENRTFLPQLRDVERFIARTSHDPQPKLKSRKTAVGPLVRALSTLGDDEIRRLAESKDETVGGDYAALAREIMARR